MRIALLPLLLALPIFAANPPVNPRVKLTTNQGAFTLELNPTAAPKTVANFLNYVRKGFYKGTTFHRIIPTFMIQGGAFTTDMHQKTGDAPIQNEAKAALEAGLHNTRGTIAMARTGDPNSATSQFFINVVDNSMKLDVPRPDGFGYCVFGSVIEGMDTVDKIKAVPTHNAQMNDVPVTPVLITNAEELNAAPSKRHPSKKSTKAKKTA